MDLGQDHVGRTTDLSTGRSLAETVRDPCYWQGLVCCSPGLFSIRDPYSSYRLFALDRESGVGFRSARNGSGSRPRGTGNRSQHWMVFGGNRTRSLLLAARVALMEPQR
jgi:rRNA maturation protein Nop10